MNKLVTALGFLRTTLEALTTSWRERKRLRAPAIRSTMQPLSLAHPVGCDLC